MCVVVCVCGEGGTRAVALPCSQVRSALHVTVNDVLVGVVAGAVRRVMRQELAERAGSDIPVAVLPHVRICSPVSTRSLRVRAARRRACVCVCVCVCVGMEHVRACAHRNVALRARARTCRHPLF